MTAETLTYLNSDKAARRQKRTLNYPWSKQTASRSREAEDGADWIRSSPTAAVSKRTDEIQTVGDSWQAVRTLTTVDDTYGLPIQVETAVVKPNGTGEALSDQTCTKTLVRAQHVGLAHRPAQAAAHHGHHLRRPRQADPATEADQRAAAPPTTTRPTAMPRRRAWPPPPPTSTAPAPRTRSSRPRRTTRWAGSGPSPSRASGTTETQYTPGDAGGPVTSIKTINAEGPRRHHDLRPRPRPGADGHRRQRPGHPHRVRRPRPPGEGLVPVPLLGRQVTERRDRVPAGDRHPERDPPRRRHRPSSLKDDGTYSRQVTDLRRPDAPGPDPDGGPRPRPHRHGHPLQRPRPGRRADQRLPRQGRAEPPSSSRPSRSRSSRAGSSSGTTAWNGR